MQRGGGVQTSKKLLAALAVMAVAFVVLAAVPSVATDSDAANGPTEGVIATGYASDATTATALVNALGGFSIETKNVAPSTVFMVFHIDGGKYNKVEFSRSVDGTVVETPAASAAQTKTEGTFSAQNAYYMFTVQKDIDTATNADSIAQEWSAEKTYTLTVTLSGEGVETKVITADVKGAVVTLYQDVTVTSTVTVDTGIKVDNGKTETFKSIVPVFSDLEIRLNGHDLTFTSGGYAFFVGDVGNKNTVTLKIVGNKGEQKDKLSVGAGCSVAYQGAFEIYDIDLSAKSYGAFPVGNASKVVVSGSDVTAGTYGVATNNAYSKDSSLEIKIENKSSVTTEDSNGDSTPVMINIPGATLTISDSKIYGQRQAVFVRAGTATVTGESEIHFDNSFKSYTYKDSNGNNQTEPVIGDNDDWVDGNRAIAGAVVVGNKSKVAYTGDAKFYMSGGSINAVGGNAIVTTAYDSTGKTAVDVVIGKDSPTTISCGTEGSAATVKVSGLTYKATEKDSDIAPLMVSTGSVVLSGEIKGVEIVSGEATVSSDLTIADGGRLVLSKGASLTVNGIVNVPETASVTAESGSTLNVENSGKIEGVVTIESGVNVSGIEKITNAKIESEFTDTAYLGGVVEEGDFGATQRVEVDKDTTVTGTLKIAGVLHVPEGVTLTIKAGGSLEISNVYTSIIEGTIVIEGADIDNEKPAGTFLVKDSAVLQVDGTLTIAGALDVSSTKPLVVSSAANVAIESTGTVKGSFEIEKDAMLAVEGAVVDGTTKFDVKGTLTLNSAVPSTGFSVTIDDGAVVDVQNVVLKNGAEICIKDLGTVVYDEKDKNVKTPSAKQNEFDINGTAASTEAEGWSYGVQASGLKVTTSMKSTKITADGDDKGCYSHVYTMSVSGTASVSSYGVYTGDAETVPTVSSYNVDLTLSGATGAKISDALVLGVGINAFFEGTVSVEGAVTLNYTSTVVETTTVVQKSTLKFGESANISVKAVVDASVSAGLLTNNATSVKISGDGAIVTKDAIATAGVSAAKYTVSERSATGATVNTYWFVTIDAALAKTADGTTRNVEVYGTQNVTVSAEVPAGATLVLKNGAVLNIGAEAKNTDIVLTVVSGASVKDEGAVVNVNGTLYAQKKTDVAKTLREPSDTSKGIVSDVVSFEMKNGKEVTGGWAKWTNLTVSLNEAQSGDRVVLNKDVVIPASIAVKEGVVLDAEKHVIYIPYGVVLTVDGTVDLTDAGSKLAIASKNGTNAAGAVVLNGYIAYSSEGADEIVKAAKGADGKWAVATDNVKFIVAGAYYAVDRVNYVSTVANAAKIISTVDGQKVELKAVAEANENTTEKDSLEFSGVSFSGKSATDSATIIVSCPVKADGVAISNAKIVIAGGIVVDISVTGADGSVVVKGKTPATVSTTDAGSQPAYAFTIATAVHGEDEKNVLAVIGAIQDHKDSKGKDVSTQISFDGTVYITDVSTFTVDKVSVIGTLVVEANVTIGATTTDGESASETPNSTDVSVSGALDVEKNAIVTLTVNAKTMDISGTLAVKKEFKAESTTATVTGTVDAKAEGASATFAVLYIGVDEKIAQRTTSGDASVVGNVTVSKYALVAPGATVPEAFTKEDSVYKSTVFEVEGALYLTGYAGASCDLEIKKIDYKPTDAKFKGWFVAGETSETTKKIGEVSKVTANIDREIYKITIITDGGIAYVTVDGVLMENVEGKANTFSIGKLKAGSHTIGISAASGYDVSNVVLKNTDGTAVGSMTVSVSGTTTDYEYQLIGSTVAVDPTPEPTPIIIKDEDDGMSLTDILLIVLVVLIVIMAAIVALRMMRS